MSRLYARTSRSHHAVALSLALDNLEGQEMLAVWRATLRLSDATASPSPSYTPMLMRYFWVCMGWG
jgi:hypothetical protein